MDWTFSFSCIIFMDQNRVFRDLVTCRVPVK
jgi:hypothetical protein